MQETKPEAPRRCAEQPVRSCVGSRVLQEEASDDGEPTVDDFVSSKGSNTDDAVDDDDYEDDEVDIDEGTELNEVEHSESNASESAFYDGSANDEEDESVTANEVWTNLAHSEATMICSSSHIDTEVYESESKEESCGSNLHTFDSSNGNISEEAMYDGSMHSASTTREITWTSLDHNESPSCRSSTLLTVDYEYRSGDDRVEEMKDETNDVNRDIVWTSGESADDHVADETDTMEERKTTAGKIRQELLHTKSNITMASGMSGATAVRSNARGVSQHRGASWTNKISSHSLEEPSTQAKALGTASLPTENNFEGKRQIPKQADSAFHREQSTSTLENIRLKQEIARLRDHIRKLEMSTLPASAVSPNYYVKPSTLVYSTDDEHDDFGDSEHTPASSEMGDFGPMEGNSWSPKHSQYRTTPPLRYSPTRGSSTEDPTLAYRAERRNSRTGSIKSFTDDSKTSFHCSECSSSMDGLDQLSNDESTVLLGAEFVGSKEFLEASPIQTLPRGLAENEVCLKECNQLDDAALIASDTVDNAAIRISISPCLVDDAAYEDTGFGRGYDGSGTDIPYLLSHDENNACNQGADREIALPANDPSIYAQTNDVTADSALLSV
jgi:hypothetical protein